MDDELKRTLEALNPRVDERFFQDIKLTCKIVKSQGTGAKIGFVLPAESGK
jgi:hypothetical protein